MRTLQTQDVFRLSKILKKMDLKSEVKKVLSDVSKDNKKEDIELKQKELGAEIIFLFLENLHLAQCEVNELLADLVGIKPNEFNKLPIEDTIEILSLFKEQNNLTNFFKLAGQLTK